MTPEYLSRLQHGNIGVALGEKSGGLCAIDFDRDDFADLFLSANPQLGGTLQTHGARGRVFWVRFVGDYPKRTSMLKAHSCENVGEFRSNGAQSIVWGTHPETGGQYRFVVEQPAVEIEFSSIQWPSEIANPPTLQSLRDSDVVSVHSVCSATPTTLNTPSAQSTLTSQSTPSSLFFSVKSLEEAVEMSLPEREHQNYACLFNLNRALKAFEVTHGPLTQIQKAQAFSSWYEKASARGALRKGQSRDHYMVEFLAGYKCVKIPLGGGPAEQAWTMANTESLPPEAAVFESQEGKLLVAMCFQLHRLSAGNEWFLAASTAARLIGTSATSAAKWLSALVDLGILEVAEQNTNIRATRYRYRSATN